MSDKLGISGRITKAFLNSEITPLLALLGFLLGVFAVMVTPREEEPQINVTFANVFIAYPGASAQEVEQMVSIPAEQIVSELNGVKHIYTMSSPGMSILTVQFEVGENRTQAIVSLYNAFYSKQDWFPQNMGIQPPIIKPKGIDDVPIVSLTLWSDNQDVGGYELSRVAHAIEVELKRIPGTRDVYTIGAPDNVVHVIFKPESLTAYQLSLADIRNALQLSNISMPNTHIVNQDEIEIQAGQFLSTPDEVQDLVVGVYQDQPIYLRDIADIRYEADQPVQYVWHADLNDSTPNSTNPAVTIAIAKQPGSNAVEIADNIIDRVVDLDGVIIPDGIEVSVTRNYGATADAKAKQLIKKLVFATLSVVLLVWFVLGKREAFIVGVAVVITLAITLFASWAWGFTLNRVSLFALIFSIGILVDDAIVVVENIHRHLQMGATKLLESIPKAVDEVGGPTILATFTVIAALLPMAFVTGLMGPYMSPIPINASMGMLISLVIAFVVTPWLARKYIDTSHVAAHEPADKNSLFEKVLRPFLHTEQGGRRRTYLGIAIIFLIMLSVSLAVFKLVVLKMLPFDNKSEFQVVIDMPEGTTLEETAAVVTELGDYLQNVPEVSNYQAYVGTASPINFNGLVRQYYLREGSHVADIQVNLYDKSERDRKSHDVASSIRVPLQEIGLKHNANVKIVEVPPGPPVLSPLVAEIYGPDYVGQQRLADEIRKVFIQTDDIVDVDISTIFPRQRWIIHIDQRKAAIWGVSQLEVAQAIHTALNGEDVSYLHPGNVKYPLPIRLELPAAEQSRIESLKQIQVRSRSGQLYALEELVHISLSTSEQPILHKDLLPVVLVTGDLAGKTDSPLYGMFDISAQLDKFETEQQTMLEQYFIQQPGDPYLYSLKWDGEWQVTYETFRDMGIAYGIGLILIYFLVVGQFKSYLVPIIIMAPIPLTIIGVMPGHALLGAKFTATSMIGMIALAGIIVRNSILLVDFINQLIAQGVKTADAVIEATTVRAKPIILTGVAAMMGAFFILDDPIFNGLAIALIFGILVSTALTLVVIPLMYFAYVERFQSK